MTEAVLTVTFWNAKHGVITRTDFMSAAGMLRLPVPKGFGVDYMTVEVQEIKASEPRARDQ